MPAPNDNTEIDAFVKRVIGWSQLLQRGADAALQSAHDQYARGAISYTAYSDALQQKIAVAQSCYAMTNAASATLLKIAQSQLSPITSATWCCRSRRLSKAWMRKGP